VKVFAFLVLLCCAGHVWAQEGLSCEAVFFKKPNLRLKKAMNNIQENDWEIHGFAKRLQIDPTVRNLSELEKTLDLVQQQKKIFEGLAKHAIGKMMTDRLLMVEFHNQPAFMERYQNYYVKYAQLLDLLVAQLESMKAVSPEVWSDKDLFDILAAMDALMAEAHNRS
jgi:hypothetical protein